MLMESSVSTADDAWQRGRSTSLEWFAGFSDIHIYVYSEPCSKYYVDVLG